MRGRYGRLLSLRVEECGRRSVRPLRDDDRRVGQGDKHLYQRRPCACIAIGPDGFIWLLKKTPGTSHLPDDGVDFELHRYNGFGMYHRSGWDRVPGEGVAVTVDHEGQPWLVQASGTIVRRTGSGWQRLPGSATDISAGADGSVWAVGSRELPGGHEILRWAGQDWQEVPGAAVRIAVSPSVSPGSATTVTRSSGDWAAGGTGSRGRHRHRLRSRRELLDHRE